MKLLRFLPLLLLLCGCAREGSPVSALALDCKNGVYCLTAEVVRQDSPDDTAAPAYLSATGTDVTDALRIVAENTARYAGGNYIKARYADAIEPKKQDNRTCEEITADIVARCGLVVKHEST